jgi:prepilin-type processing-associated H-X9-DG protein
MIRCESLFQKIKFKEDFQSNFNDAGDWQIRHTYSVTGTLFGGMLTKGSAGDMGGVAEKYETPAKITEVRSASSAYMMSERAHWFGYVSAMPVVYYPGTLTSDADRFFYHPVHNFIHGQGFNVAFVDGHVERKKPYELEKKEMFLCRE